MELRSRSRSSAAFSCLSCASRAGSGFPDMTVRMDRPEIFWELTRSLCPECRRVIDAQILLRDNQVVMRKRCPDHGWFEALVFGDAPLYTKIAPYNKPGTLPLKFQTEVRDGCPHDCGLCPEHKQH